MAKKRSTGCCVDAAYVEAASRAHARPLFIIGAGAWLRRVRAEAAPLVFGALPRRAQAFLASRPASVLASGKTLAFCSKLGVARTSAPRTLRRDCRQGRRGRDTVAAAAGA